MPQYIVLRALLGPTGLMNDGGESGLAMSYGHCNGLNPEPMHLNFVEVNDNVGKYKPGLSSISTDSF